MLIQIFLLLILLLIISIILRTFVIIISMLFPVPFLPSGGIFKEVLTKLDIKDGDNVLDVGSGDGRVLIYASKQYPNSNFVGIEKNIFLVIYSELLRRITGRKNLKFVHKDAIKFKYSRYNKIYMYLTPEFVDRLMIKIKDEVKEGTRVVNLHFKLGYNFFNDNKVVRNEVKYRNKIDYIYLWQK
jgi:predicted RNA methylase